jgi:hypothetical protein
MLLGIEERLMAYAEGTENDTPTSMDTANFKWRNGQCPTAAQRLKVCF